MDLLKYYPNDECVQRLSIKKMSRNIFKKTSKNCESFLEKLIEYITFRKLAQTS